VARLSDIRYSAKGTKAIWTSMYGYEGGRQIQALRRLWALEWAWQTFFESIDRC